MSAVARRVAAGAAYLDEREPGWWERIDLDRLNMSAECGCVLGQLATDLETPLWSAIVWEFGLRRQGWEVFGLPTDFDLGFNAGSTQSKKAQYREYAALEAEWKRVITGRRAQARVPAQATS